LVLGPISEPHLSFSGLTQQDLPFLLIALLFWFMARQTLTMHVFKPLAEDYLGIKGQSKIRRFVEQGYALVYWGGMGVAGLYVMYGGPCWCKCYSIVIDFAGLGVPCA
jgi:acyl-CoA-dependent ceramide synthase